MTLQPVNRLYVRVKKYRDNPFFISVDLRPPLVTPCLKLHFIICFYHKNDKLSAKGNKSP